MQDQIGKSIFNDTILNITRDAFAAVKIRIKLVLKDF